MLPFVLLVALSVVGDAPDANAGLPDSIHVPQDRQAEQLFRKGVAAYGARDFSKAIEFFTAAHEISKAPEILFDIGQAYRGLGACRRALESFDAFVAAAPASDPLLPKAKLRQRELAACAAAEAPPPPAVAAKPAVPPIVPPPPAASSPPASLRLEARPIQRHRTGTTICIAAAGSAATLTVAGLALGLAASSASREVEAARVWDKNTERTDARGQAFNDGAVLTFAAAGVAGLVAATTCWLDWRAARGAPAR